jgi:hypothetical protein
LIFKKLSNPADDTATVLCSRTMSGNLHLTQEELNKLEEKLRPWKSSRVGFLGVNDRLLPTLSEDDQNVRALNHTHQMIGDYLENTINLSFPRRDYSVIVPITAGDLKNFNDNYPCYVQGGIGTNRVSFNGKNIRVIMIVWKGPQDCPFGCSDATCVDYILNDGTDEICFSGMMPHLIKKHGFYQGKGSQYRLDPERIINFFKPKKLD